MAKEIGNVGMATQLPRVPFSEMHRWSGHSVHTEAHFGEMRPRTPSVDIGCLSSPTLRHCQEIVIGWDDWKATRAATRENLRRLGLGAPSRRTTDYGTSGRRLRAAFGGKRAPEGIGFE